MFDSLMPVLGTVSAVLGFIFALLFVLARLEEDLATTPEPAPLADPRAAATPREAA